MTAATEQVVRITVCVDGALYFSCALLVDGMIEIQSVLWNIISRSAIEGKELDISIKPETFNKEEPKVEFVQELSARKIQLRWVKDKQGD